MRKDHLIQGTGVAVLKDVNDVSVDASMPQHSALISSTSEVFPPSPSAYSTLRSSPALSIVSERSMNFDKSPARHPLHRSPLSGLQRPPSLTGMTRTRSLSSSSGRTLNEKGSATTTRLANGRNSSTSTPPQAPACVRCRNRKMRCEAKKDTLPCKRCLDEGHECTFPGRKIRFVPP